MRRSEVNAIIRDGKAFFDSRGFHLPPFALWTPEEWAEKGREVSDIIENGLGWDITDFGRGEFRRCGILLFTLRNGTLANLKAGKGKIYCEKVALMEPEQVCPAHHHWVKVEDIINRGGGRLAIELHNAAPDGAFADTEVTISADGVWRTLPAGEVVELGPGESITLMPGCYHKIWAVGDRVMLGEVSVVNDDAGDNRFHEPVGRFPDIEEDEPPLHLLIQDYGSYGRSGGA